MSSNINPNNIDGTYPVAGQDNNSQGFRDNFTNTKTNFQYAADEITDLQNNAILKSALVGTVLNNDMLGSLIYNGVAADFGLTRVALNQTTGSININYAAGHFQTIGPTTGSVSLAFSNFPAAGVTGIVFVQVTVANVAHTLTLPAAVSVNAQGIQGLNSSTNVITFAATGTYLFQFITSNGGTTVTVVEANKALSPFNNSSETGNVSVTSAVGLSNTVTIFDTTIGNTYTMAAGVSGQIKTLIASNVAAGNVTVTVSNPGWGGVGNITMYGNGQTSTLMYTSSKWYCVATGPDATGNIALFD